MPFTRRKGRMAMKHTFCLGACLLMAAASTVAAGPAAHTVAYDNVHVRVSDPAKASEWYVKYLGATAAPSASGVVLGHYQAKGDQAWVFFGETLIAFVRTANVQPSVGSVIDHIGLSYADLSAKMKDFELGGAKVL